jgi:hypothetical protein
MDNGLTSPHWNPFSGYGFNWIYLFQRRAQIERLGHRPCTDTCFRFTSDSIVYVSIFNHRANWVWLSS